MGWLTSLLQALGIALGLVKEIKDEVEDPHPDLIEPPPPADKDALVHDLEAIRRRKFGK